MLGAAVPVDVVVAIAPLNIPATEAFCFDAVPAVDRDVFELPNRSALSGPEIVVLFGHLRR